MKSLDFIEQETLRRDLPPFRVGDNVRVHVKIKEGDKERIQVFEGLVIRRRGGGIGETFTVRKIASGIGVERVFPVQSPLVTRVEIKSRGYVRRSRLYYLRDLSGKKARLHSKVRDLSDLLSPEDIEAQQAGGEVEAAPAEEAPAAKATAPAAGELKGKARKRAKAKAKAERRSKQPAPQPKAEAAEAPAEAEASDTAEAAESTEESSES